MGAGDKEDGVKICIPSFLSQSLMQCVRKGEKEGEREGGEREEFWREREEET